MTNGDSDGNGHPRGAGYWPDDLGWDLKSESFEWVKEGIPDALGSEVQLEMLDIYGKLRGDRELPRWRDFDPARAPRVLPWLIVFGVADDPPRFQVRLMGTEMVEAWGADITGRWLDELEKWDEVIQRFIWQIRERRPYVTRQFRTTMAPNDFRTLTALVMPFAKDGEGVEIIVGCVQYNT